MADKHLDPSERVGWIFDVFTQRIGDTPGYVAHEWPYGVWISDEQAALAALRNKHPDPATKISNPRPLDRATAEYHGVPQGKPAQMKSK
jgi:hypothetical protein